MGRRHSSTAGTSARATRGGAARLDTYLPPWLVWLAMPVLGGIFWALASAGTAAAVAVGALLAVGSTVLTIHTYTVFAKRKDARVRWDAAITVGLACLWILATAMFGLFHDPRVGLWPHIWHLPLWAAKAFTLPIWGTWLGGGILVALAWNIRRAAMTNPETEEKQAEIESPLQKALDGAKMKAIEVAPNGQVTGVLEGERGRQTSDDLQKLAAAIESAERLREGAVRIAKDPKDRSRAPFTITPHDPLELDVAWPGPSLPGGHLADAPIPFSTAEDNELAAIWFNGDEVLGRNLVHYIVEGANGSGKSMGWRAAIADALTRTAGAGVRLHGVDVSGKWRQTFGPLIRYMTSLATDGKAAKKLIRELSAYVAEKQERMGAAGHTQWSKACGEPFDIFWLEEGSEIAADSQELTRAAERWRSAGAMLIIVIQRASWDNVDTTTMSQMGGVTAYGVNAAAGSRNNCFSLPDTATDQGADPSRWGSRHAGRHYLISSTTPEERMAIPHKSFKTTNAEIAAALAEHCQPLRTEDGQLMPGVTNTPPVAAPTTSRSAAVAPADTDVDSRDDEEMTPIPADPDPSIVVDPDKPIQPPTPEQDLPMSVPGTGGPKIPKADFRALIQQHLKAILAEGRDRTQAADVSRMRPETGYSREEVRKELVRLYEGPHTDLDVCRLRRDDADRLGVYEIYVAEPAYAA
jgi:hypothetical protein